MTDWLIDKSALIRLGASPDAEEWAGRLDTIGYEIVCGISARVPRVVRP